MGENLKALACTSRHGSCCPHISSCYRTPGLGALATALCQAPKLGVYLGCSPPGPPRGFLSPFISCSRACTLKGAVGRSHVETSPPWLDLRTPGRRLSARNSSRQGFSRMIHPEREQIPLAVPPSALRVFPCLRSSHPPGSLHTSLFPRPGAAAACQASVAHPGFLPCPATRRERQMFLSGFKSAA